MGRLDGKVAIITGGGGSGIGHGISLVFAREGATVVIVEIDLESAENVRKQIEREGGKATVLQGDISRAADLRALVEKVIHEQKQIDILVNSAGIGLIRPLAESSEEEFNHLMAVDFRGMWLCCKEVIPHMQRRKQGSIVNIGSVHGKATMPFYGLYAAMKAGVAGLTRGIAVQYGRDGIRANTICPGLVDGKQSRDIAARFVPDVEKYFGEFIRRHQTVPVMIQPEDIGCVAAFLASDEARSVTGAEIPVDAGMLALLTNLDT